MAPIPFATNSYRSRSLPVSAQRCVNMYAEQQPPDAKTQVAIFGVPGLVSFATCGAGPVRGMWVMNSVLYVVSGTGLYSVTSAGVVTFLGGAVTGTNIVSMSDNGTQLAITNGVNGYIYSVTGGFQIIASVNFFPANTVNFFDNYFVFDRLGTNQFFVSASLDGTTYSALDYASATVNPSFVMGIKVQQENLMIFKQTAIETWYDSGALAFPFARYDGATIERGCVAALSIIKQDNSVFFLGDDLMFYRLNGVIPVRVSTHALEAEWRQYAVVSDAFSMTYDWEGHKFIVVTFPTANATWIYDIATNLWHERISYTSTYTSYGRWRGNASAEVYNKVLIGDAYSGQIGYLDDSTYTEFGNPIVGQLTSPYLHSDRKRIFMPRFELDIESGVGLTTGQGSDPQIMLNWSDDGGHTFSALQLWNSMGVLGAYKQRLRWTRLGSARARILQITVSDPVKRTIIGAYGDTAPGWN